DYRRKAGHLVPKTALYRLKTADRDHQNRPRRMDADTIPKWKHPCDGSGNSCDRRRQHDRCLPRPKTEEPRDTDDCQNRERHGKEEDERKWREKGQKGRKHKKRLTWKPYQEFQWLRTRGWKALAPKSPHKFVSCRAVEAHRRNGGSDCGYAPCAG